MERQSSFAIPIAIVLAGALIAGAYFLTNRPAPAAPAQEAPAQKEARIPAVKPDDHIRGARTAPLVIIEYSDLECPFCKSFHPTMKRVMDTYGKDGTVAWVYRHLPLPQLHPKAKKEAEAAECAAELGGNDAFWKYVDRIFEITPSNNGLDLSRLPDVAEEIGLDRDAFDACLSSGKMAAHVEADAKEALDYAKASGIQVGTPFNVFISGDEQVPQAGALPFVAIESVITSVLSAQPPAPQAPSAN